MGSEIKSEGSAVVMTQAERGTFLDKLKAQYIAGIDALGPRAFSKKTRGDLIAGFCDGVSSCFAQFEGNGIVKVQK